MEFIRALWAGSFQKELDLQWSPSIFIPVSRYCCKCQTRSGHSLHAKGLSYTVEMYQRQRYFGEDIMLTASGDEHWLGFREMWRMLFPLCCLAISNLLLQINKLQIFKGKAHPKMCHYLFILIYFVTHSIVLTHIVHKE